jgi:hypothetical protein
VFQSADYRMVDNTKPLAHIGVAFEGSSWASPHYFPMMYACASARLVVCAWRAAVVRIIGK